MQTTIQRFLYEYSKKRCELRAYSITTDEIEELLTELYNLGEFGADLKKLVEENLPFVDVSLFCPYFQSWNYFLSLKLDENAPIDVAASPAVLARIEGMVAEVRENQQRNMMRAAKDKLIVGASKAVDMLNTPVDVALSLGKLGIKGIVKKVMGDE